jgi:hypothetical protein
MAVDYSQIRNQLQTGDLFTFEGHAPLDFMINLMEDGTYSHVGMVLRDPSNNLWFWDAPGVGEIFPDPYYPGGQAHKGCRVANLDDVLAFYMKDMGTQTFSWRKLTPSIAGNSFTTLINFIRAVDGTPFPGSNVQFPAWIIKLFHQLFPSATPEELGLSVGLFLTYLTGKVLKAEVSGYYFCAQLIADTYMQLGLLSKTPLPPNGYAPANFDDQPTPMKLLGSASLGPVTVVNYDLGQAAKAKTA